MVRDGEHRRRRARRPRDYAEGHDVLVERKRRDRACVSVVQVVRVPPLGSERTGQEGGIAHQVTRDRVDPEREKLVDEETEYLFLARVETIRDAGVARP